jgi:hypothetical protein
MPLEGDGAEPESFQAAAAGLPHLLLTAYSCLSGRAKASMYILYTSPFLLVTSRFIQKIYENMKTIMIYLKYM